MLRRHIWFGSTRPLLTNVNNLSPGSTLTTIYIYIYIDIMIGWRNSQASTARQKQRINSIVSSLNQIVAVFTEGK